VPLAVRTRARHFPCAAAPCVPCTTAGGDTVRISVVILNWERPTDTIQAAESVLRQDYRDFDLLIWDNASTDHSYELLASRFAGEERVILETADANYGVAGGRNRAFRRVTGDLVLSLDSDARFQDSDALTRIHRRFASDPSVGALSFEVIRPDGHLMWPFSRPGRTWREREFETYRVDGCSFAVRRRVLEKVDAFAEHFSPYGAEDQHFALKVVGAGYRVLYFPEVRVIHAFEPSGRVAAQFTKHVRNSLWIPLELFPMPNALASVSAQGLRLFRDAAEQRQWGAYLRGALEAVFAFRPSRRTPIPRREWRRLRRLVRQEKQLGQEAA